MENVELGSLFHEWLTIKGYNQEISIEEFTFQKYLEFHKNDSIDIDKQRKLFFDRVKAWNTSKAEFESYVTKEEQIHPILEPLQLWQATEMLNNVIEELDMEIEEQYRYLANVKLLIGYRLSQLFDNETSKEMLSLLESNYEREWKKANDTIADYELQDLFSETVAIMQYAGISYDDETREILAKIGFNYDVEFSITLHEKIEDDILFFTNFLLSEMVLKEEFDSFNEDEKKILAEQVIPVCVSSIKMVENGNNAQHIEQLAMTYIGKILQKENLKLLKVAVILLFASKIITTLLKASFIGVAIGITLKVVWNCVKEPLNLEEKIDVDCIKFIKKKYFEKEKFEKEKKKVLEKIKDIVSVHLEENKMREEKEMEFEKNEN